MASSLESDSSITLTRDAVSGAASYYVSLWAYVWNITTNEYEYQEVWGGWVNTAGVNIAFGAIDPGLTCYAFISAHEVDMVSISPPSPPPARADMSENYLAYKLPFPTP